MKKIILMRLTMKNFRGANSETEFSPISTTIKGWNGSGKSRHFDAFCWCLFGKDSLDRKDYEVKTRENGTQLRHIDAEVSVELEIDGKATKLTRTLKEQWVKPRGQIEEVFKGNVTVCAIDDVPMKVSDYDKAVSAILTDSVFKMVTNPTYFCNMKWTAMREMLFELAGNISEDDVAAGNKDYQELLDRVIGKTMNDYKKLIANKKLRAKKALEEIQPRIDQTRSNMPIEKDWALIDSQIEETDEIIAEYDSQISDIMKGYNAIVESRAKRGLAIQSLKEQKSAALANAQWEANEAYREREAERVSLENEIARKQIELDSAKRDIERYQSSLDAAKLRITEKQEERKRLIDRFNEIAEQEYNGSDICPTCGQRMPADKVQEAVARFEEAQNRQLDFIQSQGTQVTGEIKKGEADASALKGSLDAAQRTLESVNEELTALREKLLQKPILDKITVEESSVSECKSLQDKIDALAREQGMEPEKPETTELAKLKAEALEHRDGLLRYRFEKDEIEKARNTIKALEEEGKTLAAEIAGYEREEYIIQQFSREKVAEVEKNVNSMFHAVKFQLFDYTIDGNESECCIPLVDGIPYGAANTAGKLFAGFDIIRVLSNFYGICAPIFTDNAESLSTLPDMPNQMIYLEVARDEGMRGRLSVIK